MDKPDSNTVYEHLKFEGLAGMEKLRGSLAYQSSPDRGIKALLIVDYNDLTRTKSNLSKRQALAVVMAFDEDKRPKYQSITNRAVKAHGRTPKAELEAALEMMASHDGIMVYADKDLLNDEKLMRSLAKNRDFQSVRDKVNDKEYITDPTPFIAEEDAELDTIPQLPPAGKPDSFGELGELEGLVDSMRSEVYWPVAKPDPMAPMHDDWIRYFTMSEPSDSLTP